MSTTAYTIRRFEPHDQARVFELISKIMSEEFRDAETAYPSDDVQDIAASYGGIGEAFYVAVNGRAIAGTVGIKKEDERTALLRRLFVARESRHQKVGKRLLESALRFCDEVGYEEIIFKATTRMQAAIEMLSKCGFVQRAKIPMGKVELVKLSRLLSSGAKKLKR